MTAEIQNLTLQKLELKQIFNPSVLTTEQPDTEQIANYTMMDRKSGNRKFF